MKPPRCQGSKWQSGSGSRTLALSCVSGQLWASNPQSVTFSSSSIFSINERKPFTLGKRFPKRSSLKSYRIQKTRRPRLIMKSHLNISLIELYFVTDSPFFYSKRLMKENFFCALGWLVQVNSSRPKLFCKDYLNAQRIMGLGLYRHQVGQVGNVPCTKMDSKNFRKGY